MSNLEGTWRVSQHWKNVKPYQFEIRISADGLITTKEGFTGVALQLGASNQISLAITSFDQLTVASYVGNVVGDAMGGEVLGASKTGSTTKGTWSAGRIENLDAPLQAHYIP